MAIWHSMVVGMKLFKWMKFAFICEFGCFMGFGEFFGFLCASMRLEIVGVLLRSDYIRIIK